MNKNSYEYRRGFLDGSGNGDRMTGKTTKKILEAVLEMLDGKEIIFVCESHYMQKSSFKKASKLLKALDVMWTYSYEESNRVSVGFNNGSILFTTGEWFNLNWKSTSKYSVIYDRSCG